MVEQNRQSMTLVVGAILIIIMYHQQNAPASYTTTPPDPHGAVVDGSTVHIESQRTALIASQRQHIAQLQARIALMAENNSPQGTSSPALAAAVVQAGVATAPTSPDAAAVVQAGAADNSAANDNTCAQMLPSGIPTMVQYDAAKSHPLHQEVVDWWAYFNTATSTMDQSGFNWNGARVTLDTMKQWSRNYEYVYHYAALKHYVTKYPPTPGEPFKILDAGSGITPMTFLSSTVLPSTETSALDVYPNYKQVFEGLSARVKERGAKATFVTDNLIKFNGALKDTMFNAIHCVSVLEHTDQYVEIVRNFYNHLKPGGVLILTYDITDSPGDIAKKQNLYNLLIKQFGAQNEICAPPTAPYNYASLLSTHPPLLKTSAFCPDREDTLPWGPGSCKGLTGDIYVHMITLRKPF